MVDLKTIIIIILAVTAGFTDYRYRKVYNWLTFPIMIIGLLLNSSALGWSGLLSSLLGLLAGGLVFYPIYHIGGMGAGDIKLMAAGGAVMGWWFAVNAALYTALAGGLMVVVVLLINGRFWSTVKRIGTMIKNVRLNVSVDLSHHDQEAFPYALAIATGMLAALWLPSPLI